MTTAKGFLALTLVGLLAATSLAAEKKPMLVVFDFESPHDGGKLGKWAAQNVRGKGVRRKEFETLDEISFEEVLAAERFTARFASRPDEIAKFIRSHFEADVAIWGKVESLGGENFKLFVRGVDLRKDPAQLALDKTYNCTNPRDVPVNIAAALDDFAGIVRKPEDDYHLDQTWRTRPNLVKNGGFEEGKDTPAHWERINGLTTFWVEGESPTGKCLLIDTDVLCSQYDEWNEKFFKGALASLAPKKLPTKEPKYDTVGGTKGSHVYSDPIPVKPGMTYRFDVDVKGPRSTNSKVFIKGYALIQEKEFGDQEREIYRAQWTFKKETSDPWEHFSIRFHPTQALAVFEFESEFDKGAIGKRAASAIRKLTADTGKFPTIPDATMREILSQRKCELTFDSLPAEYKDFSWKHLGAGLCIWGRIVRLEDGSFEVHAKAADFRQKMTRPFLNEVYPVDKLEKIPLACGKIVEAIVTRSVPVVKFLRVKLDAYWPPAQYYFDNATLTEDGMYVYGKEAQ